MSLSAVFILSAFVISLPLCFWRPFYGILAWTIVSFVNPQWYAWGHSRDVQMAEMIALTTLTGMILFVRGWRRLVNRECFLLLLLWIWFTLTSIISTHTDAFTHHSASTWYYWQLVSKILVMTAATVVTVNSFQRLRILLITIGGCFGLFVAKSLPFTIAHGGNFRLYGPAKSMIADNNDFGLALNMTLPIFFLLAQTEPSRWMKRVWWLLFAGTIPAVFFTYSRGAVLGLVAISIFLFFQFKQRLLLIPVIVMSLAIAVLFAPPAWRERMDPSRPDAIDASARDRLNSWAFCWRLALDYPVTGGGFDTFTPPLFDRYAPTPRLVLGPHSVYFGLMAEHGFVGLGLYLTLIVSCFASTRWLMKGAWHHGDSVAGKYALMLRLSMVGFLVSGSFLGRAYFDYLFTIVAAIVVLKIACREEWEVLESTEAANAEAGEIPETAWANGARKGRMPVSPAACCLLGRAQARVPICLEAVFRMLMTQSRVSAG